MANRSLGLNLWGSQSWLRYRFHRYQPARKPAAGEIAELEAHHG